MDHNRPSKFQSIISVQSRKSNISNPRSLGRPSFELGDVSLQNKASLVQQLSYDYHSAMSIESQHRKSDIFQRLLESQKKSSHRPSSIINSQSHNTNDYNQYNHQYNNNQRNSDLGGGGNEIEIDHDCKCFENCFQQECPCFQAKNQMCVKGTCCSKCVELKNLTLKNGSFSQQNNNGNFYLYVNQGHSFQLQQVTMYQAQEHLQNKQVPDVFVCNCKNTECLKSYCKCFQNGQFCSSNCGCQSCKNKQHSQQRQIALQVIKAYEPTYCTCKKTKCNKKYCSCYASGVKCGKHCSCQNCANCDKSNQMDVEVYEGEEEEDFRNAEMPERMSFQPVVFQ